MFEKKRLHPVSVFLFTMGYIKEAIFPILIAFVLGESGENASVLELFIRFGVPAIIVVLILAGSFFNWLRFVYWLEDDEFRVEHGVFIRKKRYIPLERIQSIQITEGVLQRIFGLVKVRVETAGGSGLEAEAELVAVTKQEAKEIQDYIKKKKENNWDVSAVPEEAELSEKENQTIFQADTATIFILALTSGGAFGVMAAAVAFVLQFDELIPYEKIFSEAQYLLAEGVSAVIIMLLIAVVIAYCIAILQTMIKYYGFTVEKNEKDLIITHGLLERRNITIPIRRIQGIEIAENPLRSIFGYASVYVINEGGSGEDFPGAVMLCPLISKQQIPGMIKMCLPGYETDVDFISVPERAKFRYMLRPVYVILLPVLVGGYFFHPYGWLFFLAVPFFLYLGYRSYTFAGWNIMGDQLALRSRFIRSRTVYMYKNKIQSLENSATPFQRRKQLRTITAHVMSSSMKVRDLDVKDMVQVYQWYSRE